MSGRRVRSLWWATLAVLVVSVLVNVAQAHRLRSVMTAGKQVLLGKSVRPIAALDRAGKTAVVRFDRNVPTVLYFFSPTCGWCERNWENVRFLANHADGRYRLVGLAAETSIGEFVDRQRLAFEVYGGVTPETREALGLSGTPKTIVVSAQGLVTHEWVGAFSGGVAVAIEDVFDINLPGLRPLSPKAVSK